MGATEIAAAIMFFLTVSGALWGIWWKIEGRLKEVKADANVVTSAAIAKADLALMQLHEHRVHSAETFATKAGMQEQTAQLLRAIETVGARIETINERLDRAFEVRPTRTRT